MADLSMATVFFAVDEEDAGYELTPGGQGVFELIPGEHTLHVMFASGGGTSLDFTIEPNQVLDISFTVAKGFRRG